MEVEIWSDIACPWCHVGMRRFEAALARALVGSRPRAEVRFQGGLISEHRDSFSFYAWARQARVRQVWRWDGRRSSAAKVQRQARAGLDEYVSRARA